MSAERVRTPHHEQIIGVSDAMKRILRLVEKIGPTESTVLITGESGTGKEKIARFVHLQSKRAGKPFVAVNAGAIPETLIESELFGHVRGAFTDARERRRASSRWPIRERSSSTRSAEMPASMQVRLLRVLQDHEIRPVGADFSSHGRCARHRRYEQRSARAIAAGRFREDLFYRLNVFRIHMPPLRDHKDDIPFLARFFLKIGRSHGRRSAASPIRSGDTCRTTIGRATSASSRTRSSTRSSLPTVP